MEGMKDAVDPRPGAERAELEQIVSGLEQTRRDLAALHAERARLLADAHDLARRQMSRTGTNDTRVRDIPLRSITAEIAAATRSSDRTIQMRMDQAVLLADRFPATHEALSHGEIDPGHARVIVDAGLAIDDADVRAHYEQSALGIARRETPGRLRPSARMLAQRLHPVPIAERHAHAAARRGVWLRELDDGVAEVLTVQPATIAHGILDRVDQLARETINARTAAAAGADGLFDDAPGPRDTRGIDEVRADVFADLLLTGHSSLEASDASIPDADAIRAHVQVTIPVTTLIEGGDDPAELAGSGPIDADTARRLAGAAIGWERLLTDPVTGCVLSVDRYRPSEQLRRTLRARDEHCRFPGCRRGVWRCEVDHTIAREHDGPTELCNLAHLCRSHHVLKHHSAWRVRQLGGGILEWTSPLGRVYPDVPARTLHFTVDPPPF